MHTDTHGYSLSYCAYADVPAEAAAVAKPARGRRTSKRSPPAVAAVIAVDETHAVDAGKDEAAPMEAEAAAEAGGPVASGRRRRVCSHLL